MPTLARPRPRSRSHPHRQPRRHPPWLANARCPPPVGPVRRKRRPARPWTTLCDSPPSTTLPRCVPDFFGFQPIRRRINPSRLPRRITMKRERQHLVSRVDRRLGRVGLDDALAGRHLRAVGVGQLRKDRSPVFRLPPGPLHYQRIPEHDDRTRPGNPSCRHCREGSQSRRWSDAIQSGTSKVEVASTAAASTVVALDCQFQGSISSRSRMRAVGRRPRISVK